MDELLASFVELATASERDEGTLVLGDADRLLTTNFDRIVGAPGDINLRTGLAKIGNVVAEVHPAHGGGPDYYRSLLSSEEGIQRSGATLYERMAAIAGHAEKSKRESRTGRLRRSSGSRAPAKEGKMKA
jgi:hypothetical protein